MHVSKKIVLPLAVLVFLLAIGGGLFLASRTVPPVSAQTPPGFSHLNVQIIGPRGHSSWPLNAFVPVQVVAQSQRPLQRVELYINGALYDIRSVFEGQETTERMVRWDWQPGSAGVFLLTARAFGSDGEAGISDVIRIMATEAGSTISPVTAAEGDSLISLAAQNNLSPAEIQSANPQWTEPAAQLPPGAQVLVPDPPAPINQANLIPAIKLETPTIDLTQLPELGEPPVAPSEQPGLQAYTPLFTPDFSAVRQQEDLPGLTVMEWAKFWWKGLFAGEPAAEGPGSESKPPKQAPPTPTLQGDFTGCDVKLHWYGSFSDPSDPLAIPMNEDGFYIYRSRDGQPSERIAFIPPMHDILFESDLLTYTDPTQWGSLTYMVSAFNVLGESPSNPVVIPLDSMDCQNPAGPPPAVRLEQGDLILPAGMDMAYLYLQINNSRGVRIPEGDRTFLPGSGVRFNLDSFLDTWMEDFQETDFDASMEIWAWQGGSLHYLGNLKTQVHRALLMVCSVEGAGGCTGSGGGKWVQELSVSTAKPVRQQQYEVRWKVSQLSEAKRFYFQASGRPFTGPEYNDTLWMLSSYYLESQGSDHTFLFDLGQLLYPDPKYPSSELGWGTSYSKLFDFTSNGFIDEYPPDQPFTVYLRATPLMETKGLTKNTNVVAMHRDTPPTPSDLPPLKSPYPSLYDVEIVEDSYKPPNFLVEEAWGCVVIEEDPTGQYSPGQTVCPGKIQHTSDCGDLDLFCLVDGFVDSVAELGDYVIFGINTYKSEIAGGLAAIIPGCKDSPKCSSAVQSAVDYGVSALTGMPPDLPNFEELATGHMTSFILSYVAGIDDETLNFVCDADCQDKLGQELYQRFKQGKSIQSQAACINSYEAYFHGQQPACLDPSIVVHAAKGSGNYPAFVTVRITRKTTPESQAADPASAQLYRLDMRVLGDAFIDAYNLPVQGPLYKPVRILIPWMEPGESMTLPVVLEQYRESVQAESPSGSVNVTTPMFFPKGNTDMLAAEQCYSAGSSWEWVPCTQGGADEWIFDNEDW